jgi:DNA repair protein RadC
MTKRLIETGKILGIEVIDHIIITKTGFFSFKEKGLLR